MPTFDEVTLVDEFGFGTSRNPARDEHAARLLEQGDFGLVAIDNESLQPVGYGVFKNYDAVPEIGRALHIKALLTNPTYRQWVGRNMIATALEQGKYDFLLFTTASPRMYAAGQQFTQELHPTLDGRPAPPDIVALGKAYLGPEREASYPLVKGIYGGRPLYGVRPDHTLAEQFYNFQGFEYEKGDAMLCIGRVSLAPAD